MKICFLAEASSIHSRKWVEYFAQKGNEVYWISLTPPTRGNIEKIKFYRFKGNLLLNAMRIKKLIRKIAPDILHSHYAGRDGFIGALSGFHPFVLTAWGSDVLFAAKSRIKGPFVKFSLNKADLITCDAEHMKKAIIELGVPAAKIKIIHFGIDTEKFSPGEKDEKLIKNLELSGYKTVISLRNLDPIYDLETLIKSIPLILKEMPKTKFVIAGTGPQEKMLKELARSLKVLEMTQFIGRIPNDKMPKYLRIVDVYVSTSLSDAGIAASTAEAMACGLPVVITDSEENRKWINDGKNGFVVPTKNPEALAKKIIHLLKDEDRRREFGKFSRGIIKERNDYYKEMEKMEKIYNELIKNYDE